MKNLTSYILLIGLLSGCKSFDNSLDSTKGILTVEELEEVDKKDEFYGVAIGIPVASSEYNGGGFYFGALLNAKYHSGRFGEMDLTYNYPLKITDWDGFNIQQEPVTDSVRLFQAKAILSYPLISFYRNKEEVTVPFGSIDKVSYAGIIRSKYLSSMNLRMGIFKDYSRNLTLAHNERIKAQYEDLSLFTPDKAVVRQSMISMKIGVSYQSFVNIYLAGNGDGKKFTGRLTNLHNVYADVNILMNSQMDKVYTKYNVHNGGVGVIESFDGPYDLRQDLTLRRLGYCIGYEFQAIGEKKHRSFSSFNIEIGLRNGYWESAGYSFYLLYSSKLGIGGASRDKSRK